MAPPSKLKEMTPLLPTLRSTIQSFTSSKSFYYLIYSTAATAAPAEKIFILDSSFNPPTKAHLQIALSAFQGGTEPVEAKRLVLLLATQNADKAPKPASFEERVAMMSCFASDILTFNPGAAVDIAVTKHARFLDKSEELSKHYDGVDELVYLTGFDTLVRIFDTKYYPESYRLDPLDAFFEKGRVWCMFRTGGSYGGKEEQEEWLKGLRGGRLEEVGGMREWGRKIRFLGNDLGEPVSSTVVREAARRGDKEVLGGLLTARVRDWVLEKEPYTKDE